MKEKERVERQLLSEASVIGLVTGNPVHYKHQAITLDKSLGPASMLLHVLQAVNPLMWLYNVRTSFLVLPILLKRYRNSGTSFYNYVVVLISPGDGSTLISQQVRKKEWKGHFPSVVDGMMGSILLVIYYCTLLSAGALQISQCLRRNPHNVVVQVQSSEIRFTPALKSNFSLCHRVLNVIMEPLLLFQNHLS